MGIAGVDRERGIAAGYSLVLTALISAPLVAPGYVLLRDAVSTPRSFVTDAALGLGDAAPRAVPQDWLVATASALFDGGIVVKLLLVVALWAAGFGAARLVQTLLNARLPEQLLAVTVAVWNPYIAERLLQGHWSLLLGYAALPWTVLAVWRIRNGERWGWGSLAGCLAVAGITPTGGLLVGVLAVSLLGWRRVIRGIGLVVVSWAPWLGAVVLSSGASGISDPAGVAAFAARAEPGLGTLGSVAGLGGIWNGQAVPASRTSLWAMVATGVLVLIVVLGIPVVAGGEGVAGRVRMRRILVGMAAGAVLVPVLGATGPGITVLEWAIGHIPGAGLLRDSQKIVALAMPGYALGAAGAGAMLRRWGPGVREYSGLICLVACFLLVAVLPDLTWGVAGQVRSARYPPAWRQAVAAVAGPGDIAVLPTGMFRTFAFSGRAPVLDPAPRMFRNEVLQTGELPVDGRVVRGEGSRARRVEDILLSGESPRQLADQGVGWVLSENTSPGPRGTSAQTLQTLDPVFTSDELTVYRVPGVIAQRPPTPRNAAIAAHLLWAALLLISLVPRVSLVPRGWQCARFLSQRFARDDHHVAHQ